jgi:large subunit ribosomal protein L24
MNMVKRHTKPRGQVMQGGIIDKEMPIHISNVALWCKDCGKTRVGFEVAADGTKTRVCRKCGSSI